MGFGMRKAYSSLGPGPPRPHASLPVAVGFPSNLVRSLGRLFHQLLLSLVQNLGFLTFYSNQKQMLFDTLNSWHLIFSLVRLSVNLFIQKCCNRNTCLSIILRGERQRQREKKRVCMRVCEPMQELSVWWRQHIHNCVKQRKGKMNSSVRTPRNACCPKIFYYISRHIPCQEAQPSYFSPVLSCARR